MSPIFPPVDQSQSPSLAWSDKANELSQWSDGEPSADISMSPTKDKILTTDAEYELELCSASSLSQLQRPMAVYRQALVDYYLADANKDGHSNKQADKLKNVRFLRDTAENILHIAENEGLKNSGLYRQVQQVFQCSRNHALYLSGDRRRHTNQVKNDSVGNHDLGIGHKQSSKDREIHFATTRRGRSDREERSYHDFAVYDDRQHERVAFDSRPDREYSPRYHGTRRFLRREMDTMTATRDALDDSEIFDDHETIAAQDTYRDRSSNYVQVYPHQGTYSSHRGGRGLLDSWRPPS